MHKVLNSTPASQKGNIKGLLEQKNSVKMLSFYFSKSFQFHIKILEDGEIQTQTECLRRMDNCCNLSGLGLSSCSCLFFSPEGQGAVLFFDVGEDWLGKYLQKIGSWEK